MCERERERKRERERERFIELPVDRSTGIRIIRNYSFTIS